MKLLLVIFYQVIFSFFFDIFLWTIFSWRATKKEYNDSALTFFFQRQQLLTTQKLDFVFLILLVLYLKNINLKIWSVKRQMIPLKVNNFLFYKWYIYYKSIAVNSTNQQATKPTSQQANKPTNQQTNKPTNQTNTPINQHVYFFSPYIG